MRPREEGGTSGTGVGRNDGCPLSDAFVSDKEGVIDFGYFGVLVLTA